MEAAEVAAAIEEGKAAPPPQQQPPPLPPPQRRLTREVTRLLLHDELADSDLCKICMDAAIDCVAAGVRPHGHLCAVRQTVLGLSRVAGSNVFCHNQYYIYTGRGRRSRSVALFDRKKLKTGGAGSEAMVAVAKISAIRHLAFASVHTIHQSSTAAALTFCQQRLIFWFRIFSPSTTPTPGSVWSRTGSRVCRLTLAFGPEVQETELKSYFRQHAKELEAYDLLAVLPKSQSALHACAETLPLGEVLRLRCPCSPCCTRSRAASWRATLLFELLTSARLSPDGLVLSSGALNQWDLRDPFGVCALAASLGVPPDKTRACLSANCESAVEHALVRRKTAHGALAIAQIAKLPGPTSREEAQVDDGMTDLTEQQDRLIDLLLPAKPKKKKKSGA
uniref:Ribonuclease P protein subunit p30 n=1 Tax=Macrostomum lignano TaxID=282301 RepID=A0A1I8F1E1_9PLAT